jgi:ubiquitin carboxyl-terminal hydrolase 14
LNATVQCLKTVPPLTETLKTFPGGGVPSDAPLAITAALRDLYNTMDKKIAIPPLLLLQAVHSAFPRFAERGEGGVWAQQDANECWTELVRMLQQKLKPKEAESKYGSVVDQYFGGKLAVEWKNNEAPEEVTSNSREDFLQLSCFIATETKYMHSGLKSVSLTSNRLNVL